MNWKYSDDRKHIELANPPKQHKLLTGTRFASCLGLNPYSSPFQIWCECTKLVTPPFEETMYTKAGKIIEPKQREYISKTFPNIRGPEEYFGNAYEMYKWNFFDDNFKPFGGMWDAVSTKNNGKDIAMVVEFKTANSAAKWGNNTVPIYYLLQGALYAKLLGLDKVLFVASFLSPMDYAHPEEFVPDETNTIMIVKKLKDIIVELNGEYLSFEELYQKAFDFWNRYVVTGISPEFDEKLDKEYLDIIRASKPTEDNDLVTVCAEAISLAKEIKELEITSGIKARQDELKVLEKCIKDKMINENIEVCDKYTLKSVKKLKFNEEKFANENEKLYNKYIEETTSYTLNKNLKEEE